MISEGRRQCRISQILKTLINWATHLGESEAATCLGSDFQIPPMAGVSISVLQKITMQLADHIFCERDFTGVGKEFLWGLRKKNRL
jgi:hypothetical protein